MRTKMIPVILLGVLFLGAVPESNAFSWRITSAQGTQVGRVRWETAAGTYRLDPFETFTEVSIIAYNAKGAVLTTVRGTFDPKTGSWRATYGDFEMASYQIRFRISYGPNRQIRYYFTPIIPWGQ